jgi:hypothetical protein
MVNTAQKIRAAALKDEIASKHDVGWTDIADIVDKSLESSVVDPLERGELLKEARDIMITVDKRTEL